MTMRLTQEPERDRQSRWKHDPWGTDGAPASPPDGQPTASKHQWVTKQWFRRFEWNHRQRNHRLAGLPQQSRHYVLRVRSRLRGHPTSATPIAYDGKGAGSDLDGIVVTDLNQLTPTLVTTVLATPVIGDLINGGVFAKFGADGGYIKSIVVQNADSTSTTYTYGLRSQWLWKNRKWH